MATDFLSTQVPAFVIITRAIPKAITCKLKGVFIVGITHFRYAIKNPDTFRK
jgi:hypothetical protein